MAYVKDLPYCDLYGCKRPKHDDQSATITLVIPGETEPVEVETCLYHAAILARGSDKYTFGRTFTGEIEVRPIPAQPAPAVTPIDQGEPL